MATGTCIYAATVLPRVHSGGVGGGRIQMRLGTPRLRPVAAAAMPDGAAMCGRRRRCIATPGANVPKVQFYNYLSLLVSLP